MTISARFGLIYALFFGGIGIFYTYLALYLKDIGLSGTQIGIILATLPLAGFIIQPLWGVLGDVYQIRRGLLVTACFAQAAFSALYGISNDFIWLLIDTILLALLRSPISPLADALTLEYLETQGRRQEYGKLRLWGSIGFAGAAFATGALVVGQYLWLILYLYSATMFVMGVVSWTLPNGHNSIRPSLNDATTMLRANPSLLKLLLGTLLIGMTLGIVNSYLIVYLADISAPGWISGLAFAIAGLVEALLMGWAAALIRRWGLRTVLIGGIALMPLRWILYTMITDPILVLPTQLLHSASMLSLLVAAVLFVDQQLDRRWRATGQTLYQAALQGIGSAIGLFGAGIIYDYQGITAVWWACTIVGVLGLGVMIWATSTPALSRIETSEA